MKSIDLNCDMGEAPEAIEDGTQESLMAFLTSVNVACGGHAGDELTMKTTVEQAVRRHLAIGAHPGYPDRASFGRRELHLTKVAIADIVFEQVSRLAAIAAKVGGRISHLKAHGALYNQAARETEVAEGIAAGVARWRRDVVLVGLAGSRMLDVFRGAGFTAAAEAFADRRYDPDGSLRSRKFADALILEPADAAAQALRIVQQGKVVAQNGAEVTVHAETICIHGDTPGAVNIAAEITQCLSSAGIALRSLESRSGDVRTS